MGSSLEHGASPSPPQAFWAANKGNWHAPDFMDGHRCKEKAGAPKNSRHGFNGSGRDELPGQRHLDGITVLVQHIQSRFGHVSRRALRDHDLPAISPRQVICEEAA